MISFHTVCTYKYLDIDCKFSRSRFGKSYSIVKVIAMHLIVTLVLLVGSAIARPQPHEQGILNRVVNGSEAGDGQFPYQISLRRFELHHCGGSIITRRFILTAAHCVGENLGGSGFET